MNYQITSDNMQVSPSMEMLAKEKFERLEHRAKDIPEGSKTARIVMNTAPDGMFAVKVHVVLNGEEYFSDETDYSLEGALIKTVEELINMLQKKKDIRMRKEKEHSLKEVMSESELEEDTDAAK